MLALLHFSTILLLLQYTVTTNTDATTKTIAQADLEISLRGRLGRRKGKRHRSSCFYSWA